MSLLAFFLLQAAAVSGDTAKPCYDPQTQLLMTQCAYANYKAADEKLNVQWKVTYDYMKALDKGRDEDGRIGYAEALLKAQRNWIAFRDSHCLSVAYQYRGGSAEPMLHNICLTQQTERRIEELESLTVEG